MVTTSVVFLFDADFPGIPDCYGDVFDSAFLRSLSSADPEGCTNSSVLRGDALAANLATKITSVSKGYRQLGYGQALDTELLSTVIWDVADAISEQWNTLDQAAFPLILGQHSIHCICLPTLPDQKKWEVDGGLRCASGYLGAVELDLGNPIQRPIFLEWLIKDAAISDGHVVLELDWEGNLQTPFEGAESFQPGGLRVVAYGALAELHPAISVPSVPSPRGSLSLERYQGKRKFSLQERVIAALSRGDRLKGAQMAFEIEVTSERYNPLDANLPEAKFIRYLLDPNHPDGGSKAKFFRDVLGIEQGDWRYLAAQLHDGLKEAKLSELGVKSWNEGFGITFNAVIPVKGLNGRTVNVDSNWMMEPGMQPRLSTAVPSKQADTTGAEGTAPRVVNRDLHGSDRWQAIFELAAEAGHAAAEATIPTPMFIAGFGIEPEGKCGFAWIRLKDARRGFARWSVRCNRATRHHRSGAQIFAPASSQSIDRRLAYALAFAKVLRHNGVECEVESRLD